MVATVLSKCSNLSPKELFNLVQLKTVGYQLIQIQLPPVSSLRGRLLGSVALPDDCRVVLVSHQGIPTLADDSSFLQEGDTLYVLTKNEEMTRRYFMF